MTEAEWNSCTDPQAILTFLRNAGKLSDRKARLFAVACCRRIWPLLTDERSRRAVEVAERYADGTANSKQLRFACTDATQAMKHECDLAAEAAALTCSVPEKAAFYGSNAASCAVRLVVWQGRGYVHALAAFAEMTVDERHGAIWSPECKAARMAELKTQSVLLCDIFGPLKIEQACLPPADLALAQAAYDDHLVPSGHLDPAHLGVLGHALEEAGCTNALLLEHLRGAGPHVRGCWALDLVLRRA